MQNIESAASLLQAVRYRILLWSYFHLIQSSHHLQVFAISLLHIEPRETVIKISSLPCFMPKLPKIRFDNFLPSKRHLTTFQRLASLADLQRSMLEICQFDRAADMEGTRTLRLSQLNTFSESAVPSHCSTRHHYVKASSPLYASKTSPKPTLFTPSYAQEPPRKRRRSSVSPGPKYCDLERGQAREQFPPSPPSSHSSIAAEPSPQPTRSMAIGSLLTSTDTTHHTRGELVAVLELGHTKSSSPQTRDQAPSGPS